MPADGTKVRFPSLPRGAEERWRRAAKTVLGLDETRSDRFVKALPRAVVLAGAAQQTRDRIAAQLGRESVDAEISPEPVRGEPCTTHPRALIMEECPRCHERSACALCLHAELPGHCARCRGRALFWTRFRNLRVAILLLILAVVFWTTYGTRWRLQNWSRPVSVAIYPIAADPGNDVLQWASSVGESNFRDVEEFLDREGHRYGVDHPDLVTFSFGEAFSGDLPPAPPESGSSFDIGLWSLKVRWWNFTMKRKHHLPSGDVEIYVLYHSPAAEKSLDRSLALEKLRLGVVHAIAGRENQGWTALATAHELLHTVGATDKYGAGGIPLYPDGYAEPLKTPRLPQNGCEVMAGDVPVTERTFWQPQFLRDCLVGEKTAREIGWRKN